MSRRTRSRAVEARHGARRGALRALHPTAPGLAVALPADAPPLGLRDPESVRGAWVSGGLATAVHAGALGALFLFAWIAPDVLEETLIPVTIMNEVEPVELPGSNEAPKELASRAPASAAALAAAMARAPVPQDAPSAADLLPQPNVADRRSELERLEASQELDAPKPLDIATLSAPSVDPADLAAPKIDIDGPRHVQTAAPTAVSAPQAFAGLRDVGTVDYAGEASAAAARAPSGATFSNAPAGTGIPGSWMVGAEGGGGTGSGTGTGIASVPCLESAYTHRYLGLVEARTRRSWQLPEDAPLDSSVTLRVKIDVTGTPTVVEFLEAADDALGRSAVEALRAASPFPPMDDNVRCLAEWTLRVTLISEQSS